MGFAYCEGYATGARDREREAVSHSRRPKNESTAAPNDSKQGATHKGMNGKV